MSERFDFRHCDAMELLASLPDGLAAATITDPPYGTTANAWDKAPDWQALMAELLRVTAGAVCVFSQMPVAVDVVEAARSKFRYQIVWRKNLPQGFLQASKRPLRAHEVILVFCRKGYGEFHPQMTEGLPYVTKAGPNGGRNYKGHNAALTLNDGKRYPVDVQDFDSQLNGIHPTQKPLELIRYLVRTYSNRGGVVIDPYAGSGTTGEACAMEERRFIGSELDGGYYEKALDRVRFAYAQGRLFDGDLASEEVSL